MMSLLARLAGVNAWVLRSRKLGTLWEEKFTSVATALSYQAILWKVPVMCAESGTPGPSWKATGVAR